MLRKLLIISLVWAILILILCSIPGDALPGRGWFNIPHFDKIVHFFLYFPLAIFLIAEFDLSRRSFFRMAGSFFTMLIIAFYGGIIEVLQEYLLVGRSADVTDFLADLTGGLTGIAVYYLFLAPLFRKWSKKESASPS